MTDTDRGKKLDALFASAAKSGDMKAAIKSSGMTLSSTERKSLESLTATDLHNLQSLRTKLAPLGRAVADNNGGVF